MYSSAEQKKIRLSSQISNASSSREPASGSSLPNSLMLSAMAGNAPYASPVNDLGDQLRSKLPTVQQHVQAQIPEAESEADRLSASVRGTSPEEVKADMGRKMGADFSGVRFHTDAAAMAKADAMGARAYTSGADVYFGEGGFDASVAAHELVHTAQQGMVDSGVSTVSAPTGGVQMMPKWMSNIGNKIKKFFGGGNKTQDAQNSNPVGTSMADLGGAYSADEMQNRTTTLLPAMKNAIAKASEGKNVSDGNRFYFMRNNSGDQAGNQAKSDYFNMLKRSGRETNKKMLVNMSQDIASLPDVSDVGSYKNLAEDDSRRSSYQDRGLAMTQKYLDTLQEDPDALDALRKSAEMYNSMGEYSENNLAGMAHGRLEASHRAMNDMILRSFGGDTVLGRRDLGLNAADDKKVGFTGQAMAAMQPAVLGKIMNPDNQLTPQEEQLALMYQQFFEKNYMLGGRKTSDETMSYRTTAVPQDYDPKTASDDETLAMLYNRIKNPRPDDDEERISMRKREFARIRANQLKKQK